MKCTQKPVSIFPNNVLLKSHEILHFGVISHEYNIFKCVSKSPFCPHCVRDIATWSYQTRGFHLLITLWHIFPVHYCCFSYINKLFVTKMSCLLPRAKLLRVTFFMKRSYLFPREKFKLPFLPNQTHWDPGICTLLRSSHTHSIHQKSRDFIHANVVYLALICAVWSSRGRAGKKVTAVTFFRCPTVNGCSCESVKVFWDRKCLDLRGTRTPNLRIHAECSNLLSYQGQTFAVPCFGPLALAV